MIDYLIISSVFRQGFGTDIALVFLIDKILKSLDESKTVVGVFRPK